MTTSDRAIDLSSAPVSRALLALVLGILAVPGSTVAWALPAGGLWIGAPLAIAAIAFGVQSRRTGARDRRAIVGIALGGRVPRVHGGVGGRRRGHVTRGVALARHGPR